MHIQPADIVKAAVEAVVAELKKHGMEGAIAQLPQLFTDVLGGEKPLRVVLITPTGDAASLKDAVQAQIKSATGKNIMVEQQADPSLIGGAILQYGDERIDLSVKGRLSELELALRKIDSIPAPQ